MKTETLSTSSWSTASYGGSADTSPMELSALGEHVSLCKGPHGRIFAMHHVAHTVNRFVTARFVTTLLVAVVLLFGLSALVI